MDAFQHLADYLLTQLRIRCILHAPRESIGGAFRQMATDGCRFYQCVDGSLYCGWTTEQNALPEEHSKGNGAKYAQSSRPVEPESFEESEDRHEALSREWHIQRMPRQEHFKLMNGFDISLYSSRTSCIIQIAGTQARCEALVNHWQAIAAR